MSALSERSLRVRDAAQSQLADLHRYFDRNITDAARLVETVRDLAAVVSDLAMVTVDMAATGDDLPTAEKAPQRDTSLRDLRSAVDSLRGVNQDDDIRGEHAEELGNLLDAARTLIERLGIKL